MLLVERLREDLKNSLKSGAAPRAGVLRLLLSETHNKEKEKFGGAGGLLEDRDALAVLQKEAKKRKEAAELFRKGQREDLAKKEEAELAVIGEYLPTELGAEEVGAVIDSLLAKGLNDFNSLMREAMKELKGRADGRFVGEAIKNKLSGR